ncbi:hypothetical protein ACRAWD_20360 [Caulobacter segnis]
MSASERPGAVGQSFPRHGAPVDAWSVRGPPGRARPPPVPPALSRPAGWSWFRGRRSVNLMRREADIAISLSRPTQGRMRLRASWPTTAWASTPPGTTWLARRRWRTWPSSWSGRWSGTSTRCWMCPSCATWTRWRRGRRRCSVPTRSPPSRPAVASGLRLWRAAPVFGRGRSAPGAGAARAVEPAAQLLDLGPRGPWRPCPASAPCCLDFPGRSGRPACRPAGPGGPDPLRSLAFRMKSRS